MAGRRVKKPRFCWTVVKEEKLVELWRERDCLFDVSSNQYHDKVEKGKMWTEIAAALEIPVSEVKTRGLSLRTQYCRLIKPLLNGSSKRTLTSKQRWLKNNLDFLLPFVVHRHSESSLDHLEDCKEQEQDHDVSPSLCSQPGPSTSPPLPEQSPLTSSSELRAKRPRKSNHNNDSEIELQKIGMLREMSQAIQSGFQHNDQSLFGQQVAAEVWQIKDPTLRTRAKKRIMNILYDMQEEDQLIKQIKIS